MKNPVKMDDLGVLLILETPIYDSLGIRDFCPKSPGSFSDPIL